MRRSLAVLLAVAVLGVAACSDGSDEDPLADGSGGPSTGSCTGDDLDGEALLDCVGPAIAFVETTVATGSGVLIDGGYVVTNAHVVDPYAAADITFADGSHERDVPVVGIDAFTDIAVLGPLSDLAVEPLTLSSGQEVAKGHDVFLIGYPGEADEEPEPTISRGVLSRVREAKEWEQTYLQTDASIGGGQSGGALIDGAGRVLGISGLSFAEEFALALDGSEVQASVDRILDGRGDTYLSVPGTDGAVTDHDLAFDDPLSATALVIAPDPEERTLEIEIGDRPDIAIAVFDLYGEPLLVNRAAVELSLDQEAIEDEGGFGIDPADPVRPGTYEVDLPEDVHAIVQVASTAPGPTAGRVRTSLPSVAVESAPRRPLALGEEAESTVDSLELSEIYTIDLRAGDEVEVSARSPQGDMAVDIYPPGAAADDFESIDDGGGGLYDVDAEDTYEAEHDGSYRFYVYSYDGVVTGYRFSVTRAE